MKKLHDERELFQRCIAVALSHILFDDLQEQQRLKRAYGIIAKSHHIIQRHIEAARQASGQNGNDIEGVVEKYGSSLEPVGKKLQYSRKNLINL